MLTATLVALIWTCYHTYQTAAVTRAATEREKTLREHVRDVLYASVVTELHFVASSIESTQHADYLPRREALEHPMLTEAMKRTDLFSAVTTAHLVGAGVLLRTMALHIRQYEENRKRGPHDLELAKDAIRSGRRFILKMSATLEAAAGSSVTDLVAVNSR